MSTETDLSNRRFLFDGSPVTWDEFAEVNEPETLAEIALLAVGETAVLGQCDEIERLPDVEPICQGCGGSRLVRHPWAPGKYAVCAVCAVAA